MAAASRGGGGAGLGGVAGGDLALAGGGRLGGVALQRLGRLRLAGDRGVECGGEAGFLVHRIARGGFGGGGGLARGDEFGARGADGLPGGGLHRDGGAGGIAGGSSVGVRGLLAGAQGFDLAFQHGEAVLLRQALGGGARRAGVAAEAVPPPQRPLAGDEPLAGLQLRLERRAVGGVDHRDLREAAAERGGGVDLVRQHLAAGEGGVRAVILRPSEWCVVADGGRQVVAQRDREGDLVAGRDGAALQRRVRAGACAGG